MIEGTHYLNSGDWVESMSALLEHEDGTWEVYMHTNQVEKPQPMEVIEFPQAIKNPMRVAFSNNFFNPFF
jgi:hypothetical protein